MYEFITKCTGELPTLNYKDALGTEIILEFFDCDCTTEFMCDTKLINNLFNDACEKSNLTIVSSHCHEFSPYGLTIAQVLSESLLSAHTYPEYKYLAINLFYCGNKVIPENCLETLYQGFKPSKIDIKSFSRGNIISM